MISDQMIDDCVDILSRIKVKITEPDHVDAARRPETAGEINSARDLVAYVEFRGERRLAARIRSGLRVSVIREGFIAARADDKADRTLLVEISRFLQSQTGEIWRIGHDPAASQKTVEEIDAARQAKDISAIENDPAVARILEFFPGARIVNVTPLSDRFRAQHDVDDMYDMIPG